MENKSKNFLFGLVLGGTIPIVGMAIGVGIYNWNRNNQPNNQSNKVNMDVTGYTVNVGGVECTFSKGCKGSNDLIEIWNNGCAIFDGGYYNKLDGKVDKIFSRNTSSGLYRKDLSEAEAKKFDELLATYKKELNIKEIHKKWLSGDY